MPSSSHQGKRWPPPRQAAGDHCPQWLRVRFGGVQAFTPAATVALMVSVTSGMWWCVGHTHNSSSSCPLLAQAKLRKVPAKVGVPIEGELSRPTFASLILPIFGIFWSAQPQPSRFADLPDADQPFFLSPSQSGVELGSLPICLLFGCTFRGGGTGIEGLSGKLLIDHSHSRSVRWDWLLYPLLRQ